MPKPLTEKELRQCVKDMHNIDVKPDWWFNRYATHLIATIEYLKERIEHGKARNRKTAQR